MTDKELADRWDPVASRLVNTTPSVLTPVASNQRIDVLDVLRGFALIGILLMNIEWFSRPILSSGTFAADLSGLDHAAGWLIQCFVEGKFYKLFALLFGMGFAIMMTQAVHKDKPFAAWFSRRMVVLFVFGIIHMFFVWQGDILHAYAFTGLLMLGFIYLLRIKHLQKFNNPKSMLKLTLWWLSAPILLAGFAGVAFGVFIDHQSSSQQWQKDQKIRALITQLETKAAKNKENKELLSEEQVETFDRKAATLSNSEPDVKIASATVRQHFGENSQNITESTPVFGTSELTLKAQAQEIFEEEQEMVQNKINEIAALKDGSYWQASIFRIQASIIWVIFTPIFALSLLLPIFLLGYWFVISGTIKNYAQYPKLFTYMARIGLGVGFILTAAGLTIMRHPAVEHVMSLQATAGVLNTAGEYFMAAGYLGLIVRLLDAPKWQRKLLKLAPMGRMALTNYIMHSIILTSIFYGYAGGFYGEISRAPQMLIVLVIILIQIPFSSWWLTHYQFGPLEWFWRSITYKKWQAFKVQSS
jgi:uncharacterized protein